MGGAGEWWQRWGSLELHSSSSRRGLLVLPVANNCRSRFVRAPAAASICSSPPPHPTSPMSELRHTSTSGGEVGEADTYGLWALGFSLLQLRRLHADNLSKDIHYETREYPFHTILLLHECR